MGRRTTTSFDDELSTKMRGVVSDVLDRLQRHGELGHVRALYSPSTQSRIDAAPSGPFGALRESEKFPYTFEHFVEHLDPTDGTFHNLMELLITLTARKAIASAAERCEAAESSEAAANQSNSVPFPSSSISTSSAMHRSAESAFTTAAEPIGQPHHSLRLRVAAQQAVRTTRECQREMVLCRAVQGEIRTITRRNRRSRGGGDDSDTSSESMPFSSTARTRTVFSTLVDPTNDSIERANAAATTRASRVGQREGNGEQGYHWIQRDLSSIRRRLDQRRDDISGRSNQARGMATWNAAALTPTANAASTTSHVRAGESEGARGADNVDHLFVRRFLSQPFPSDVRRPSSSASTIVSRAVREAEGTNTGMNATIAPQILSPPSPVLFTNTAASLDPTDANVVDDADVAAHNATAETDSGAQARLEAVQAALNRLNPSRDRSELDEQSMEADMAAAEVMRLAVEMNMQNNSEFEAFSARRRVRRRASRLLEPALSEEQLNAARRSLNPGNDAAAEDAADRARMESAVLQLIRADDTIRRITDEHVTTDTPGVATGDGSGSTLRPRDPLAVRLQLPPNDGRAIAHLPPRSRTRSFHRDEHATL